MFRNNKAKCMDGISVELLNARSIAIKIKLALFRTAGLTSVVEKSERCSS